MAVIVVFLITLYIKKLRVSYIFFQKKRPTQLEPKIKNYN